MLRPNEHAAAQDGSLRAWCSDACNGGAGLYDRSRVGLQVAESAAPQTPPKKAVPLVAQSLSADQILNLYGNWCVPGSQVNPQVNPNAWQE
jgi:hypothetical protein